MLTKPFSLGALAAKVRTMIERWQTRAPP